MSARARVLSAADWRLVLQGLMPRGRAWPRDPDAVQARFLGALGEPLAAQHARILDLLERESNPALAAEMLADWEAAYGLPDDCTGANADTAGRRGALLAKIIAQGGQSRAYFVAVAAQLGYAITIEEFRPFRVDIATVETPLYDTDWIFTWLVRAPETTVTEFQVERSTCEDPLRSWGNDSLECVLNRLKPARTAVLFAYGV